MDADVIGRMLPLVLQAELEDPDKGAHSPLAALVSVMEVLHQPVEATLAHLDSQFAPYRATDEFVVALAAWVDLTWLAPPDVTGTNVPIPGGVERLRDLVAAASRLSAMRGTRSGLADFIEAATGWRPLAMTGDPQRPFTIVIHMPEDSLRDWDLVSRVVEHEKPAHVATRLTTDPPEVVS